MFLITVSKMCWVVKKYVWRSHFNRFISTVMSKLQFDFSFISCLVNCLSLHFTLHSTFSFAINDQIAADRHAAEIT